MTSFDGKVIAVTGAASGMGLATAQLLASRGAIISLADINEEVLKSVLDSLPGNGHIYQTIDKFGKLDGAVNMAGIIAEPTPLTEYTDEVWDRMFAVNTRGVFNCLRAELKTMTAGGSIVSAASVFGQFGAPGHVAYCASKAAVIGLSRTAAKENEHIRVNCVSPGSVSTAMNQHDDPEHVKRSLAGTVQKRRAEPIEVARVIAFLLSDEASFVTGAVDHPMHISRTQSGRKRLYNLGITLQPLLQLLVIKLLHIHIILYRQDSSRPRTLSQDHIHRLHPNRRQRDVCSAHRHGVEKVDGVLFTWYDRAIWHSERPRVGNVNKAFVEDSIVDDNTLDLVHIKRVVSHSDNGIVVLLRVLDILLRHRVNAVHSSSLADSLSPDSMPVRGGFSILVGVFGVIGRLVVASADEVGANKTCCVGVGFEVRHELFRKERASVACFDVAEEDLVVGLVVALWFEEVLFVVLLFRQGKSVIEGLKAMVLFTTRSLSSNLCRISSDARNETAVGVLFIVEWIDRRKKVGRIDLDTSRGFVKFLLVFSSDSV
ncbi:hypothetical protein HG531_012289 [Fusarium graminearum]|nr:hypothetical protein HG531_012289 [Fusarium graminearum]